MLIAHGANKVFGKGGLEGTTRWFDGLGLKPGWVHARLAALVEMGAGALITIGFLNPLPYAAVVGLMSVAAATDHKGKGFFVFKGGWEYAGIVAAASTALAALGNGRYSVDALIGNNRKGLRWALAAALFGVANAAILLKASYRPESDEETNG
jgi:putative oxidoreductase